jgi:hypothetical protein
MTEIRVTQFSMSHTLNTSVVLPSESQDTMSVIDVILHCRITEVFEVLLGTLTQLICSFAAFVQEPENTRQNLVV